MNIEIPFQPSVYGGESNDDVKQTVSISLTDDMYNKLQKLDNLIIEKLQETYPESKDKWCSFLKPAKDKYEPLLKCQIFVNNCRYYGMDDTEIKKPDNWRRLKANAIVNVSGVYINKNQAGLIARITSLQFDPDQNSKSNPFSLSNELEYNSISISA